MTASPFWSGGWLKNKNHERCAMRDFRDWTRRRFLKAAGAGAVAAAVAPTEAASGGDRPDFIIDCHPHIYGEDEKKYPTIEKPYRPPAGSGTVEQLRREALQVRSEGQKSSVRFVTAV